MILSNRSALGHFGLAMLNKEPSAMAPVKSIAPLKPVTTLPPSKLPVTVTNQLPVLMPIGASPVKPVSSPNIAPPPPVSSTTTVTLPPRVPTSPPVLMSPPIVFTPPKLIQPVQPVQVQPPVEPPIQYTPPKVLQPVQPPVQVTTTTPVQIQPQSGGGTSVISPFPPVTNTLPGSTTTVAPVQTGNTTTTVNSNGTTSVSSGLTGSGYQLPTTSSIADRDAIAKQVTQVTGQNMGLAVADPMTMRRNLVIAGVGAAGAGYFGFKAKGAAVGAIAAVVVFVGVYKVMGMQK